VHMADAVNKGCKKILICSVDADVVVLAVEAAAKPDLEELWIAFGIQLRVSITTHACS